MKTSIRQVLFVSLFMVSLGACSDDPEKPTPTDTGVDAAGFDASVDAGGDVGPTGDAGGQADFGPADVGSDAGFDAGLDVGGDTGSDLGHDAGTDVGFDLGMDAGYDAGRDLGADAGHDAGFDAGSDAGTDAGGDAGTDAGLDAGSDAGTCADNDNDGYEDIACGGTDCDDAAAAVNPGAVEVCDNQTDDDCNAATPDIFDGDGDSYTCDVDCDDAVAAINPGATEVCDNQTDDDCNAATPDLFDGDNDSYTCDVDCDDAVAAINPGATEVCDNQTDDDCNAATPDLFDGDNDSYTCDVDCDDAVAAINPGATEVCDNQTDDDCNAATPDIFDGDNDSYTCDVDCDDAVAAINPGATEVCDNQTDDDCNAATPDLFDGDGDSYTCDVDCDDAVAAINPGATEVCDNQTDDDCNAATPDIFDGDNDSYTCDVDCDDAVAAVNPGATEVCDNQTDDDCNAATPDLFDGDGDSYTCDVDCNDAVAAINPGATEVCDNQTDDDCNAATPDLFDGDGDSYTCDVDCDDAVAAVNPGATEVCDNQTDDDCNAATPDIFDGDNDSYTCDVDCDDAVAAINPGATEICDNGDDDDCDGRADDLDDDCSSTVEVCDNGVDDDGDSDVDCADTDCAIAVACEGDSCVNPLTVAASNVSYVIDVSPLTDTQSGTCGLQSGVEAVFAFTLTADSDVHIDTEETDFDTVLYLRSGTCDTGTELACDDDVVAQVSWSRLEFHALPAGDYYLFADANGPVSGDLTVNFAISDVAPRSPIPVTNDPLVRMPGTQPNPSVALEGPGRCLNCHEQKNNQPLLGSEWKGTMMAQASRDPIFWAAMSVAAQDSVWVLGNANATDLCERCHFPEGWLEERSDPTNASLMTGSDYDGVHCDVCHQMVDPFATATAAGTREGNDWAGYWDEANAVSPSSATRAATTLAADQTLFSAMTLFNGDPLYDMNTWLPALLTYVENGSGQMYVDNGGAKRGPFADDTANHQTLYSRYHKSKYMCQTCHDVSNPVLANLGADPTQALPSESQPASTYFHVERTFSEFMLSDFAQQGGAPGTGFYDPSTFDTKRPNNNIASCQDCHMPQSVGVAVDKNSAKTRPTDSLEHVKDGVSSHTLVGGNAWIPRILASTVPSSPNYDTTNEALLNQGPSVLTLDFTQGLPLDPSALLAVANAAEDSLGRAATITNTSYSSGTGALTFRVVNHTGHKLISGFPEGRRMFVNIVARDSGGNIIEEVNPYDTTVGTLKGLDPAHAQSSPPLGPNERREALLVYEMNPSSTLTGEEKTFHFVLADGRYKDNRIPPRGFDIANAAARLSEPVIDGQSAPNYFTQQEYDGGYDEVSLNLVPGAATVEITLYYQTTSREYMEFLRDQLNGTATTLYSPTPAGAAIAYIAQTDPFFGALAAWGDTMWQLWEHNMNLPGAAPIEMVSVTLP